LRKRVEAALEERCPRDAPSRPAVRGPAPPPSRGAPGAQRGAAGPPDGARAPASRRRAEARARRARRTRRSRQARGARGRAGTARRRLLPPPREQCDRRRAAHDPGACARELSGLGAARRRRPRLRDPRRRSGAGLREGGTTNRTHLHDYAEAIGANTALLLKVHTSNYRVVGFTADVSSRELVELGRARGIPVMEDLGSGSLVDLRAHAFPYEPTVPETVAAGVDLVSFSGDKLLGGPQAGIVVGKQAIV